MTICTSYAFRQDLEFCTSGEIDPLEGKTATLSIFSGDVVYDFTTDTTALVVVDDWDGSRVDLLLPGDVLQDFFWSCDLDRVVISVELIADNLLDVVFEATVDCEGVNAGYELPSECGTGSFTLRDQFTVPLTGGACNNGAIGDIG